MLSWRDERLGKRCQTALTRLQFVQAYTTITRDTDRTGKGFWDGSLEGFQSSASLPRLVVAIRSKRTARNDILLKAQNPARSSKARRPPLAFLVPQCYDEMASLESPTVTSPA